LLRELAVDLASLKPPPCKDILPGSLERNNLPYQGSIA